jgi:[lysine-biosynthesis-protein LysW]--L-2-aminoadipate ligase
MEGVVGILGTADATNGWLAEAWRDLDIAAVVVSPADARLLDAGDVLVGRLDVLQTLDGVEPGLSALRAAVRRGVTVVNPCRGLLTVHDKLLTAVVLARAGVPHPRTERVAHGETPTLEPPVVVKPRYGSWGRDVDRCMTRAELERHLARLEGRGWFRRHGALVQELLPAPAFDLRLIVAGGRVVGGAERIPAAGEWRTNTSLGGSLRQARPSEEASALALAAAEATGCGFVGVDLLPVDGSWVVLELNGTVDFDRRYSLPRSDVYAEAADALGLPTTHHSTGAPR